VAKGEQGSGSPGQERGKSWLTTGTYPAPRRDTVTRRPPARLPRLSCIWAGWASVKAVVERVLSHSPGVRAVEANPVSQTATVAFDTTQTSVDEPRRWVEECG